MFWAVYHQRLNPLADKLPASNLLSIVFAALPVLVLFWLLVPRRWLAPKAGAMAALFALVIAVTVYAMPPLMAGMAFVAGALFGLLPVGWTIFNAMLLYNVTVQTGKFDIVRRSVAGLSGDARVQAILIAFAFGAFLEGSAGGGTPVAICGAILVGLGFDPFLSAVLCLIANTSPVAYGGLGTPLITLNGVTSLPTETLSVMAGHQLPLLSLFIPLYMVKCMCSWKQTWEVWPALLVAGGSFAVFQFFFATMHVYAPSIVIYPMTDIGGGIFSLIVTAVFLKFWKPRQEWHFEKKIAATDQPPVLSNGEKPVPPPAKEPSLTAWNITVAWFPFVLMSILLLLTGLVRQREGERKKLGPVSIGPIQTNYLLPIPGLDKQSFRDARLQEGNGEKRQAEEATFNFAWLTSPGSAVFAAALLSMALLRMNRRQIGWVFKRTFLQMKIPIPTICFMLGLSYVTRYAGMDATLGFAFAGSGVLYPFFAPLLGWLGVFLTGTDAGSNALFGSLQKITATQIYSPGVFPHLDLSQLQVLICTSNSTGGVMGKMIDAQSIVVATAATNQLGKEADIFKAVLWHSILLAVVVGLLTLLQAYVFPFTQMVPHLMK
ncbi:MAG TPA: L-lactate permease [Gemmataceae bacterium]|nr:L-lactate permease [Gemmataceae bacterium]